MCYIVHVYEGENYQVQKSQTITIRVSPELKGKLAFLAKETRRSASFLAAEALSRFVDSEAEIISGIKEAIAELDAGKGVDHKQVMQQMRSIIEQAKAANSSVAKSQTPKTRAL